MKQHTTKEETQHLIRLEFPKPKVLSYYIRLHYGSDYSEDFYYEEDGRYGCWYDNYSIGDLIEFLPKEIETKGGLEIVFECGRWIVMHGHDPFDNYYKRTELIDALFDYCVKLKKEGVI